MPVRIFLNTIFAPKLVRGMDGLVVCAMAGARRGRGFEPQFLRPSRGPSVRPPPPPLQHPAPPPVPPVRRVACLLHFFPNPPTPTPPTPRRSDPHTKNEAPGTAHLQQRAPSLLPPSAGWRMSSSYSSSACPRKRTRTGVFRAGVCCATAPPRCAKPSESLVPLSLHPPCLPLHECFPCMSAKKHKKTRHQARHTCSSAPRHRYRRPPGGAFPPRSPPLLAGRGGLELGSSRYKPASRPLYHTAQTPPSLNVFLCVCGGVVAPSTR